MKRSGAISGHIGGWVLIVWITITVLIGIAVLPQTHPPLEDLHSYEAILSDCNIFPDRPRSSYSNITPHRMTYILVAMKLACPITGPNTKSVSTFEMLPPRNLPEEKACDAVNQYKGEVLKIYYSTSPDLIRFSPASETSYPLWQIDYKRAHIVTFDSQVAAWHADANIQKIWFLVFFCVPALLMTVRYIFKIRRPSRS